MPLPQPPTLFPEPSPLESRHSEELIELLRRVIGENGGAIDFSRYMEIALYAPAFGYYTSSATQFGEHGDFTTAPEISSLLGQCLARQCAEVLERLGSGSILEAGAGTGHLCVDILAQLERIGQIPERYFILELSAALQAQQRTHIQRRLPHLFHRIQWLTELPPSGFDGVILGNEVLDAMPVELFKVADTGIRQLQVSWENDGLRWTTRDADSAIADRVVPLALPNDYVSEIGLIAEAWIRSAAACLQRGVMLLVDYGFPRHEFYHPQRGHGTLMCHYRHRAHADPLILPGLQDITAHVDFTAVAEAGAQAGLSCLGFTSQAAFLLATGIDQHPPVSPADQKNWAEQVRKLTLPHEMGELFKVIALARGIDPPLRGFTLTDRRAGL